VRTNVFIPIRFWTIYRNFDKMLSALYTDVRKNIT